jgi:hypothetical protein
MTSEFVIHVGSGRECRNLFISLIDISRALESALISFAWLSTRLDGFRALVKGAEGAVPRVW